MTSTENLKYSVNLYDGDDSNGVASIVGTLLEQNFHNMPQRIPTACRMRHAVAIYSTDTDTSCSIMFGAFRATVYNGIVGKPRVTVFATVDQILDVSQLRMLAGGLLPVGFFTKRGITVLKQILAHRLVVKGLITHPFTTLRLLALVSVIES
ncbi:hypothetical protein ACIBJI_07970 [Nocardia sp. NPDC050408]|uniref:hypothetical protein n=1 Tax=Nocardia sp. NPDC050408 TaxID=3364319 RepID=UPI00379CC672